MRRMPLLAARFVDTRDNEHDAALEFERGSGRVIGPVGVALASLVDEDRVAINVAPRQFLDYRFVERLKALLAEWRLPTSCIELELTESVLQPTPRRSGRWSSSARWTLPLRWTISAPVLFIARVARAAADQPREAWIVVCSRASMRARGPLRSPAQRQDCAANSDCRRRPKVSSDSNSSPR
jgi:hypothetical protein